MESVFICHSSADKLLARWLAIRLKMHGFVVWIDEGEIGIGDSLIQKISAALECSDFVVAVVSENSINSNWVQKELSLALTREITDGRTFVLPVLVGNCDVPFFLRDKLYADFRNRELNDEVFFKILAAISKNNAAIDTELTHKLRIAFVGNNVFICTLEMPTVCPHCGDKIVTSTYGVVAINSLDTNSYLIRSKIAGVTTYLEWKVKCPLDHEVPALLIVDPVESVTNGSIIEKKCLERAFVASNDYCAEFLAKGLYERKAPGIYINTDVDGEVNLDSLCPPVFVGGKINLPAHCEVGPFVFAYNSKFQSGSVVAHCVVIDSFVGKSAPRSGLTIINSQMP